MDLEVMEIRWSCGGEVEGGWVGWRGWCVMTWKGRVIIHGTSAYVTLNRMEGERQSATRTLLPQQS